MTKQKKKFARNTSKNNTSNQAISKQSNLKSGASKKQKTNFDSSSDLLDIIDNYLLKKQNLIFWILFAFSLLFSLLLFDLRVSVGGDDTTYLLKSQDFIKEFKYPAFQGPLYPIIISPFIAIFGMNLPVLKFLSFIFLGLNLFIFYRAFRNRIPATILLATILLISINSYMLFFASQTYAEAFFILAQTLFFIWFFKRFIEKEQQDFVILKEIPGFLLLGLFLLGLGLIKNIGYGAVFAVLIYFLFEKKWKSAGLSVVGFGVIYGVWQFFKYLVWSDSKTQFTDQASTLFLKHPYDPSQGLETLGGFVQRFFDNSNIYLSRQLFKVLGLRPELIRVNGALVAVDTIPFLSFLVYVVIFLGFIYALHQNKFLKFTAIFLCVMMGITFIVLQPIWEAHRLIIPMLPLMIMILFTGFYQILKYKKLNFLQFLFPVLILIVFLGTFQRSSNVIKDHQKILNAHLRGNITAGFTPDWVNFINMSIWAAKNVPPDKVIASRKPSISAIYGKRRFFGIYSVESTDPDTLLNYLHQHKVEYVIAASLRKNEAQNTGEIINTIQRYLYFIQTKYPEKIRLVNQIGTPEEEPAYLFKIE